jgi:hypothetical protein
MVLDSIFAISIQYYLSSNHASFSAPLLRKRKRLILLALPTLPFKYRISSRESRIGLYG